MRNGVEKRRPGGGDGVEKRQAGGGDGLGGAPPSPMAELSRMVQKVVEGSSWWERRGVDCSILGAAFAVLPAAFLLLGSRGPVWFLLGVVLMGAAHAVITMKGTHLASHGALSASPAWRRFWAVFFIEVCGSFSAWAGVRGHVGQHHAHTNVLGLGDSSIWKLPRLPAGLYLLVAPLALPVATPLVALAHLGALPPGVALRTLLLVVLGLGSQFWLLVRVSGFGPLGALVCMLVCRGLFSVPYVHVNIFQHIGLPMFCPTRRPQRIQQMSHGVLNLPRNRVLDWTFGHSLVSCHVEHHLFPSLSDHMCLKVKPLVSGFLRQKQLPYQEDGYLSRLHLFYNQYQQLMVEAPPITELLGLATPTSELLGLATPPSELLG